MVLQSETARAEEQAPPHPRCTRVAALALGLWLAVVALPGARAAEANPPEKYAGTYRIEGWRALQERHLYHFFYLQPDGRFLLAAEWPGNERSQFVGTWSVADDRLYLNGQGRVDTNQGRWSTAFERTYRIRIDPTGFVLQPEPRKNRYGLLGWPQAFRYLRAQPAPNLPGLALPDAPDAMATYIAKRLAAHP